MCPKSVVHKLRRLCQKSAKPDASPPLKCCRGASICDTFRLHVRFSGDTLSYCVALVSPMKNERVTLGTTADDCPRPLQHRQRLPRPRRPSPTPSVGPANVPTRAPAPADRQPSPLPTSPTSFPPPRIPPTSSPAPPTIANAVRRPCRVPLPPSTTNTVPGPAAAPADRRQRPRPGHRPHRRRRGARFRRLPPPSLSLTAAPAPASFPRRRRRPTPPRPPSAPPTDCAASVPTADRGPCPCPHRRQTLRCP